MSGAASTGGGPPKVERLVNVVIALLEARRPMTFAELRRRTGFYAQGDAESARRMFERDKDELRALGVPLETRPTDGWATEDGYIIDRAAYELPDVEFSADELAAVALAVRLSGDQAPRLALTKLAARRPDVAGALPEEGELAGATRVTLDLAPVDLLAGAVAERRPVRFRYRTGEGDPVQRTVDPWVVAQRAGSWYLVGHDHDREARRTFRLDRIDGRIRALDPTGYEIPDRIDDGAFTAPTTDLVDATVAVAPEWSWQATARGARRVDGPAREDGRVLHLFEAEPRLRLLAWVLPLGDAAVVVDPPGLRDEVVARLDAVLAAHGAGA